ncbi:hypothetical protein C4J98_2793 [Pseudomonas orientalis]|nr:hypothetical protein C4J98_2793 [Pseudomonas orientalis]
MRLLGGDQFPGGLHSPCRAQRPVFTAPGRQPLLLQQQCLHKTQQSKTVATPSMTPGCCSTTHKARASTRGWHACCSSPPTFLSARYPQ